MALNRRRIRQLALARRPSMMAVGRQPTRSSAAPPPVMAVGRQPTRSSAVAPAQTAAPVVAAGAAPATAPAAPTAASVAPVAGSVDLARQTYAHMAWALDDPELGPVLTKAAQEGWDENRLRGAIFATQWFKTHGTAKVAAQLKEQAGDYLVRLTDDDAKRWGMQVITGQVQGAEFVNWAKEQAKVRYPTLASAIDRGVTVKQYASQYVADAANELGLAPESIDLNDPKWGRVLEGEVDPKTGQRAAMTRFDWVRTLKTDSLYGYDSTPKARQEAAGFIMKLEESFGARG